MKSISVTTALAPFSSFDGIDPDVLAAAARRGTRIHKACELFAHNIPTLALEEQDAGYFTSFRSWFSLYVKRVVATEKLLTDEALGYHGHVDLIAELMDGRKVVVDYKTPATESSTWRAQLAAYRRLATGWLGYAPDAMALRLMKSGAPAKAITYQYSDRDFAAFLSALNAYRYFRKEAA